jgi:hypothetical protein
MPAATRKAQQKDCGVPVISRLTGGPFPAPPKDKTNFSSQRISRRARLARISKMTYEPQDYEAHVSWLIERGVQAGPVESFECVT